MSLKLAQLAKNASPGPWKVKSEWTGKHSGADVVYASNGQAVCQCDEHDGGYGGGERNVEYIAAASPDVVMNLFAHIEVLEKALLSSLQESGRRYDQRNALAAGLREALDIANNVDWHRSQPDEMADRLAELEKLVAP